MVVIPFMVGNDVNLAVQTFTNFNTQANIEAVAKISNATIADQDSVKQMAKVARTGEQVMAMESTNIEASLSALSQIEDGKNKMLDKNSMMTALDDYL